MEKRGECNMLVTEYCQYVGRMKQPLQKMEIDNPSMFALADSLKTELDLILLTPGTFLHAYRFILRFNPKKVCIFVPSMRPEFISDVFNLYMRMRGIIDISWVFPKEFPHFDFSKGQIKTDVYVNSFNQALTVTYLKNEEVSNVYDIAVRSQGGTHYFSFCLTESKLKSLYRSKKTTVIHIPKSSTLYGGLSYDEVAKLDRRYLQKVEPHDFTSIEELYKFKDRPIPDGDLMAFDNEPKNTMPEDFEGDVTTEEILALLSQDTSEGGVDNDPI
mgnify:CR=1 FL=1